MITDRTTDRYIHNAELEPVRQALLMHFEHGELHSRSTAGQILPFAMEALADAGLPRKQSLALMVGRQAQTAWIGIMQETAQEVDG